MYLGASFAASLWARTMRMYLSAMLRASRTVYEGHCAVKDKTETPPPGGLTADTWPRQTQTSGPGAKKDQKVLGRPVDPKLRGSLTT